MKVSHYVAAFVAGSLAIASSAAIGCSIAGSIDSPQQLVSGAERIYLAQLAHALGLDPATTARLESEAAARIDAESE